MRDLDDGLSMVHLFAALPAVDRIVDGEKIPVSRVHNCRRLLLNVVLKIRALWILNCVIIRANVLILFLCDFSCNDGRRLSHEWQAYISRTHKLRKTFISVKGIYYQVCTRFSIEELLGVSWISYHSDFILAGRGRGTKNYLVNSTRIATSIA